jgi:lysophospholipase L1-like esterase
MPRANDQADAKLRFLALGDSYTVGESVAEHERWPVQLAAMLRDTGLAIAEPEIIARTGWTTGELHAGIDEAGPVGPFDLVLLLIGVNNQYRGLPIGEYRSEFRALLASSIGFAGGDVGRVVVVSIPDWSVTPFAQGRATEQIAAEIDQFNEVNRSEATAAGARYLDITGVSREAAAETALIAGDGLHPSGAIYTGAGPSWR